MADEQCDGPAPSTAVPNETDRMPAARALCADTERVLAHLAEVRQLWER